MAAAVMVRQCTAIGTELAHVDTHVSRFACHCGPMARVAAVFRGAAAKVLPRAQRLAELARRQAGVVSAAQLYALGYSRDEIRLMVRRGHLHRIHQGVYAVGHTALSDRGRLVAALLTAPTDAFLSHFTAPGQWSLAAPFISPVHLTIPGTSRHRRHDGIVVHRTRRPPDPGEVRRRDGLLVASVPRLLVELSPLTTQRHLERLITEAVRHRCFELGDVEATLARHRGQPGTATLRRALQGYLPPVASGWEEDFYAWLMRDPRVPEPERDARLHGWEVDLYWPEQRFVIELDGAAWHASVFDMGKDRRKDTQLQLHGIRVMRIDEQRWRTAKRSIRSDVNRFLGIVVERLDPERRGPGAGERDDLGPGQRDAA
jgi:hypothetical protein